MSRSINASPRVFWVLFCTIIPSSMGFLSSSMLNVALPTIQEAFSATGSQLLWFVNVYNMLLASLILIGGALGDRFGRRRVFATGIVLFTVGSLLCGIAGGAVPFIVFRAVQGLGGALMIPGSLALIAALVTEDRRGSAIGVWSAATSAAIVGAPIIGGALAGAGLWRFMFFINIPLAFVVLIALWVHIPENKNDAATGAIDGIGTVLITVALGIISYGFIEQDGSATGYAWVYIWSGVVLIGLFVWRQARASNPLMPLALFRVRQFVGANLMTFFLYGALQAVFFFLALNLIQLQGYTPQQAGFALIPSSLLLVLLSNPAGRIADRFGPRLPITFGTIVAGIGMWLFSTVDYTAGWSEYWSTFFVPILLSGIGIGFVVAPLSMAVMSSTKPNLVGTASGVNNAISRVASVFAITILGAVALGIFQDSVTRDTASYRFPPAITRDVLAEAENLGNAQVPPSVPDAQRAIVTAAYRDAFLRINHFNARVSAVLCWISTVITFLFFGSRRGSHRGSRRGHGHGRRRPRSSPVMSRVSDGAE